MPSGTWRGQGKGDMGGERGGGVAMLDPRSSQGNLDEVSFAFKRNPQPNQILKPCLMKF